MKKVIIPLVVFLLSSFLSNAQKLVVTEVDAAQNSFFNEASIQTLGKKMDLNFSGNTLAVKIGSEPNFPIVKMDWNIFSRSSFGRLANGTRDFSTIFHKDSFTLKTFNSDSKKYSCRLYKYILFY